MLYTAFAKTDLVTKSRDKLIVSNRLVSSTNNMYLNNELKLHVDEK